MFGGERLKRTCIASNNPVVMALQIHCNGQHTHKPWTVQNGHFDTALEAEYTPELAKALATTILPSLVDDDVAIRFSARSKKMKLSHFSAISSQKQPTQSLPHLVSEFAYILTLRNISTDAVFPVDGKSQTTRCVRLQFQEDTILLPC